MMNSNVNTTENRNSLLNNIRSSYNLSQTSQQFANMLQRTNSINAAIARPGSGNISKKNTIY